MAAAVALGAMLMIAGCATSQPQQQEPWGTAEEYQTYGQWNDPYAMGYGYDPFSPWWYSPYPYYYYYPRYYYPYPPYIPPRPRPPSPIRPKGGGGGRHPLAGSGPAPSPPTRGTSRGPSLGGPMRAR